MDFDKFIKMLVRNKVSFDVEWGDYSIVSVTDNSDVDTKACFYFDLKDGHLVKMTVDCA